MVKYNTWNQFTVCKETIIIEENYKCLIANKIV